MFVFFILLLAGSVYAQPFTRVITGAEFIDSGRVMLNPFSGGHNNIKPQFVDIDADGDKDMVFLDGDGTFGIYENRGSASSADFKLLTELPPGFEIKNWFWLADMDGDGDFDLFTGTSDNFISYYINTGTPLLARYTLSAPRLKTITGDSILTDPGCNPVFVDVDADGDFDLISGNSNGTLSFYKNTGGAQNPQFEFITETWMNILIIGGGFSARHGASAIDFGDIDGDGDLDIFWGDFFGLSLYYLENTGSGTNPAYVVRHSTYPQNEDSILTSGFNMPRLSDIDGDGDLDLFISVLYDPTVPQVLMMYENMGTQTAPDYRLRNRDVLRTMDAGIQSYPAFTDLNGDGKKDLFLSNAQNPEGSIFYFENISTAQVNKYNLADRRFMNISGELALAAEFGDLNGDGKTDLLLGNFNGTLSVFINSGTLQNPVFSSSIQLADSSGQNIDIGIYAKPRLYDFDADGDLDLIIGGFNGRSRIYKNNGTAGQWFFVNAETQYNIPDAGDNSAPLFYDYNRDGKPDLFIGNKEGYIWYLENTGTVSSPVWTLITENFLGASVGIDAVPYFYDFDGDGDDDLLIGNYRGGLIFYRNDRILTSVQEDREATGFEVAASYPNPFNSTTNVNFTINRPGTVTLTVFDISGAIAFEINFGDLPAGKHNKSILFPQNLASGVYYYQIQTLFSKISGKLVFLK